MDWVNHIYRCLYHVFSYACTFYDYSGLIFYIDVDLYKFSINDGHMPSTKMSKECLIMYNLPVFIILCKCLNCTC